MGKVTSVHVTVIYGHDTMHLHLVGHGVVLCEVNWWRFVRLFK